MFIVTNSIFNANLVSKTLMDVAQKNALRFSKFNAWIRVLKIKAEGLKKLLRKYYLEFNFLLKIMLSIFFVCAFGASQNPKRGIRIRRIPIAIQASPTRTRTEPRDITFPRKSKIKIISRGIFLNI